MRPKTIIHGASSAVALLAGATAAPSDNTHTPSQAAIDADRRQRQAREMRGKLKRTAKAATVALVKASGNTLDLHHVHPRWLRRMVSRAIDAGHTVTELDIAAWRSLGPPK